MTRVHLLADVQHHGAYAARGEIIECADALADRLVRLGLAEPAPEPMRAVLSPPRPASICTTPRAVA